MVRRINPLLLVLLVLLIFLSPGKVEGLNNNNPPFYSLHKGGGQKNARKLLMRDAMLEYDYPVAGHNTKHDPRKGQPGAGNGKNS